MSPKPDIPHKLADLSGVDSFAMNRWLSEVSKEAPWLGLQVTDGLERGRNIRPSNHNDAGRSPSPSGATWGSVVNAEGKTS